MANKRKKSSKHLHPLIEERLITLGADTDTMTVNSAKQLVQELALLGLQRGGFFQKAAFHGGTAFRICYGLDRFSEDLDFCLLRPESDFSLHTLLLPLQEEIESWGLEVEIVDKSRASSAVKKAFLKESSLGAQLNLSAPLHSQAKLTIKIELDVNPPLGAEVRQQLCQYPIDFYVTCHTLESMFAGKIHALLCRMYEKGRDWYDLLEYISRKTIPNYTLLYNALKQAGPYKEKKLPERLSTSWIQKELTEKISSVSIENLLSDVRPFIKDERKLSIWSTSYFIDKIQLMRE